MSRKPALVPARWIDTNRKPRQRVERYQGETPEGCIPVATTVITQLRQLLADFDSDYRKAQDAGLDDTVDLIRLQIETVLLVADRLDVDRVRLQFDVINQRPLPDPLIIAQQHAADDAAAADLICDICDCDPCACCEEPDWAGDVTGYDNGPTFW